MNGRIKELIYGWYDFNKSTFSLYDKMGAEEMKSGIDSYKYQSMLSLFENIVEVDNKYLSDINPTYNTRESIIKYLTYYNATDPFHDTIISRIINKIDHYLIENYTYNPLDLLNTQERNNFMTWRENSFNEVYYTTIFKNVINDLNKMLEIKSLDHFQISTYIKLKYDYLFKLPNIEKFLLNNKGNVPGSTTIEQEIKLYLHLDKEVYNDKIVENLIEDTIELIDLINNIKDSDCNEKVILAILHYKELLAGYLASSNNDSFISKVLYHYNKTRINSEEYRCVHAIIEEKLVKKILNKAKSK